MKVDGAQAAEGKISSSHLDESRQHPGIPDWPWFGASRWKLVQAAIFGIVFGFLLQKGGVAKFDILIGALLLENFVVVKVMLSAILVGMIGVHLLQWAGILTTQIKETVIGGNIVGGLVFGIGFALIAYCPGTDAAAVGQGNLDAIVGIVGMTIGSYLFALTSPLVARTLGAWGRLGKATIPSLIKVSTSLVVACVAVAIAAVLMLLELFTGT